MCHVIYIEVRGQLSGYVSLLPPCGSGVKLRSSGLGEVTFTHLAILQVSYHGAPGFSCFPRTEATGVWAEPKSSCLPL